jgi:hypothetical protein
MLEEDAKKKVCHVTMKDNCITSECMAWQVKSKKEVATGNMIVIDDPDMPGRKLQVSEKRPVVDGYCSRLRYK